MDFPVADLLDNELSEQWLLKHLHPRGLKCPHCDARRSQARGFRRTRRSQVTAYRCRRCDGLYNVYSGTIFQARHLRPAQVVLLLRGVCKGEPTAALARELSLPRSTVHVLRQQLQRNAQAMQPDTPLPDGVTETDEMFQNAGEKRRKARRPCRPAAPPG
jgi:transposase-like protein